MSPFIMCVYALTPAIKIENPADDPRDFQGEGPHDEDVFGAEDFMCAFPPCSWSTAGL